MASLPDTLRRRLEKTVVEAHEVAEAGARAAVERLAVGRPEPFAEMAPAERELRVQLRSKLALCESVSGLETAKFCNHPRLPVGIRVIGLNCETFRSHY